MVTRTFLRAAPLAALLALAAAPASAQPKEPQPQPQPQPQAEPQADAAGQGAPRVHHAPVASAPEHQDLSIQVFLEQPQLVRAAWVVYAGPAKGGSVRLERSSGEGYVAIIPAASVEAPRLGYTIELERVDGTRIAAFASRAAMHEVEVQDDLDDARERALYERLGHRRSVATMSTEIVRFGHTAPAQPVACPPGAAGCPNGIDPGVEDQFWRVEGKYTYRPLTRIAEFSLRGGVVRGTSLVSGPYDLDKRKVGLNYGAPTVRFRATDAFHIEAELLTSITESGFSVGTGAAFLVGDAWGTHLTLGFETIGLDPATYFGSRFYSRMDVTVSPRVTIAPVIEVTDMPHAETFGVRLLGEADFAIVSGFGVGLLGGYQARRSTSGGASFGGHASLAF